jgi:subtilisin family serine protease
VGRMIAVLVSLALATIAVVALVGLSSWQTPAPHGSPATPGGTARSDAQSAPRAQSESPAGETATRSETGLGPHEDSEVDVKHAGAAAANDRAPAESLDDADADRIARTLENAIRRAEQERGVRIDTSLIDALRVDDGGRIIVQRDARAESLEPRLVGARHGAAHYFHNIPFATLDVGPEALLTLIESGDVLGIERDRIHRPSLMDTIPLINADDAALAGHDGDGYAIAVLDTGVDLTHPFYASRLVDEACFSAGGDCPNAQTTQLGAGAGAECSYVGCDHGTAVAGIALGANVGAGHYGVAPASTLISIQVYSDIPGTGAGAYTSDLIAALEHVYDLRAFYDIATANMSLGDSGFGSASACDVANRATRAIIDLLRSADIATIASTGNDGYTNLISAPACVSTAVSVGATDKGDVVASFSNSDDFLLLLAPGDDIVTSHVGGGFAIASGTSMAVPHVSGAWAAMLEAVPGSTVHEVLYSLRASGVPIEDPRNFVTTPRIDLEAAIDYLMNGVIPDETPGSNPGGGQSGGPANTASSGCGLVGLEVLLPLLLMRSVRTRRAVASTRR